MLVAGNVVFADVDAREFYTPQRAMLYIQRLLHLANPLLARSPPPPDHFSVQRELWSTWTPRSRRETV